MSLCHQCVHHARCNRSRLPDELVRNILFMATSIPERDDLLSLVGILYDQEFKENGTTKEAVLEILDPLISKCPYLR